MTGLPLPPDGHLLLFGFPHMEMDPCDWMHPRSLGEVIYLPAGTLVEERKTKNPFVCEEGDEDILSIYARYPESELCLLADVSLPEHALSPHAEFASLPGHPHAQELVDEWGCRADGITVGGPLQIGGYAFHESVEIDPAAQAARDAARRMEWEKPGEAAELPAPEEWVLLAQWNIDLRGREMSRLHWMIPRQDIAERRFDRAYVTFDWNP